MKTEAQARSEFAAYFLDLKASMARDGATVSKQSEWEFFVEAEIDEERLPVTARAWACPRSLKPSGA